MFTESNKLFNVVLFVIMAIAMLAINSAANAGEYEVKAHALTVSFNTYCNNLVAGKVKSPSRYNVRAFMKARLLEREAGFRMKACRGNLQCLRDVRRNSIKKMHASPELRKAGYFGWSASTFEAVKAEAIKYGFVE